MTRIFTDGAEMGDTQFWDWQHQFIDCVNTVPTVGGEYCYSGAFLGTFRLIPTMSEFYLRYRLQTSDLGHLRATPLGGPPSILGWRKGSTGLGRFGIDSVGRFCAVVGTTIVETSTMVMQEDVWYLIELHVSIDDLAGRIEAFVDGTQIIDFTGDTKPGTDANVDNIDWSSSAYTCTYLDDLALNDINGASDNSWCGDGIIMKMVPVGDGTHNDWTNSDGDSISNWSYVDEYPNDGDLTYVYHEGDVSGVQDQYELSDLDYTNKIVLRIYAEARARKTSPDASQLKIGILPSGGVDELCAARDLFADDYSRIVGDEFTVNPVDSNPWEESDLDSLEYINEIA